MKKRITITFDNDKFPKTDDVLYYVLKTNIARSNHGEDHPQMLCEFTNKVVCSIELTKAGNYTIKLSK